MAFGPRSRLRYSRAFWARKRAGERQPERRRRRVRDVDRAHIAIDGLVGAVQNRDVSLQRARRRRERRARRVPRGHRRRCVSPCVTTAFTCAGRAAPGDASARAASRPGARSDGPLSSAVPTQKSTVRRAVAPGSSESARTMSGGISASAAFTSGALDLRHARRPVAAARAHVEPRRLHREPRSCGSVPSMAALGRRVAEQVEAARLRRRPAGSARSRSFERK